MVSWNCQSDRISWCGGISCCISGFQGDVACDFGDATANESTSKGQEKIPETSKVHDRMLQADLIKVTYEKAAGM